MISNLDMHTMDDDVKWCGIMAFHVMQTKIAFEVSCPMLYVPDTVPLLL